MYEDYVTNLDPGVAESLYMAYQEKIPILQRYINACKQNLSDLAEQIENETDEINKRQLENEREDILNMAADFKAELKYMESLLPLLRVKVDFLVSERQKIPQVHTDNADEVEIIIGDIS